jgi:hypothetical protein
MRSVMGIVLACAVICFLCTGCDEDSSRTMVPHDPLGIIVGIGQDTDSFPLAMMWVDGDVATDLFSVYLKAGDSAYEKKNDDLVRRGPIFGIPSAPTGLGYIDFTFDIESTLSHSYYVVATNSYNYESAPSEEIVVVPADIDPAAHLTGLAPDTTNGVGLTPTFSWDAVPGAASYCFVFEEDTQDQGGVLKWIYRTTKTSVTLASTEGMTYLDDMGTSLQRNTDYNWSVYAVNSNNCTFAASYAEFSTRAPEGDN